MRMLALLPVVLIASSLAACSGAATPTPASSVAPSVAAASEPAASAVASTPAASSAAASASAATGGSGACAAAPAGATAAVTVTIKDFAFSPQPVEAKVGDVVAWSNQDGAPHSASMDDGICATDTISGGSTAMLVFTEPGTYTYHCAIHPSRMKGYTVVVK
jgi:plastocyanin